MINVNYVVRKTYYACRGLIPIKSSRDRDDLQSAFGKIFISNEYFGLNHNNNYLYLLISILLVLIVSSCENHDEEKYNSDYRLLTLDDIKAEYKIVDSLNTLSFQNELDTTDLDRYVVVGIDSRNDLLLVRRCDQWRLMGCLMYGNVFGLFYDDCDSAQCEEIDELLIVDYEGFGGIPRYIGCSPIPTRL